jgi:putative NADH-flavin reductase
MKVLVIGAAGRTGRAVVERAVKQGHEVTAFVHSDGGYDVPGVKVRTGDASDMATMEGAVAGQDAVIDTVGGKAPYKHTTLESSVAKTVVGAMQRQGVHRLVVTSMYGGGDSAANAPFYVKILMATFLRGEVPDKTHMESTISGSTLDWVITRPPFLTEKPAIGDVRIFSDDSHDHPHSITRSDLAAFMVDQLTSDDNLGKAVTIANR